MDTDQGLHMLPAPETQSSAASSSPSKAPWQEPTLTFVEPMLTIHGSLEELTGAFFGGFSPGASRRP